MKKSIKRMSKVVNSLIEIGLCFTATKNIYSQSNQIKVDSFFDDSIEPKRCFVSIVINCPFFV